VETERPPKAGLARKGDVAAAEKLILAGERAPIGPTLPGLHELLSGIAESIAAPVIFLTPTGEIEVINQRLLDFFGKTREEMEGWASSEIIHPDDRALTVAALKHAMETGEPYEVEARRRRADGAYRWWRSNGYPMRDPDGRIARWCVLYTDIDDRKVAEEKLHRHEYLANALLESVAVPMSYWKPNGDAEAINSHVLKFHGKTYEELKEWDDVIHPDDLAGALAAWQRASRDRQPYQHEMRFLDAEGQWRWRQIRNFPMRDTDGEIIRWCVLNLDIDDRKRAEEALAASEKRLEQIINTIPAMAWSANPDGVCDYFNQHHLDYVGLSLQEMQGFGFVQTFHPDDTASMMAHWQVMLDTGRGGEVEGRIRRHDGKYRWFLFRTNPQLDASGKVVKWFGINVDIEDSKRGLDQLRESEINLRRLTETIPQNLWGATREGAVDYVNGHLREWFGGAKGVMNDEWINLVHPDDRERTIEAWTKTVAAGSDYQQDVRFLHWGGQYRWCVVKGRPLRDESGSIIRWHGVVEDMQDWKQVQDDLRQTQSELAHVTRVMTMGQLTASIAHELNQPLAGIMTNAGFGLLLLDVDPPDLASIRQTAERTMRDAQRASDVVSRLRALFARRAAGSEVVDVNTAVRDVLALLSNELHRNAIVLRPQLVDCLPRIVGDRVQLQQVIVNFIVNAAEAMSKIDDRARELTISTAMDGADHVRVAVKDVGVGIDPADAERIFNAFYTTKPQGMGVGLSVSRTIIENHKGKLWAEANGGPGSTFFFSIPCLTDKPSAVGSA
jgi:PAS domain S-box-containing protein